MAGLKILVFEYISGGGMAAEPLPLSLAREGDLMLGALLRDLSDIPDVRIRALRDARLEIPAEAPAAVEWIRLNRQDDGAGRFRECIADADAVWPIAPETDGILERLCRWVESAGKGLLSSPPPAVRIAASKLRTIRRLEGFGIPVVPTQVFDPAMVMGFPVVVKPDDGVGGEGARVLNTPAEWKIFGDGNASRNRLVQPWLAGEDLSLSVLFAHGEARLLGCNRQHIFLVEGGPVLRGCGINAVRDEAGTFRRLAERIGRAMPELWGYAGIDLMRTGGELFVLEINPRLTTSYAGLRKSTGLNPAALVLESWRSGRLPEFDAFPAEPVEIFLEP